MPYLPPESQACRRACKHRRKAARAMGSTQDPCPNRVLLSPAQHDSGGDACVLLPLATKVRPQVVSLRHPYRKIPVKVPIHTAAQGHGKAVSPSAAADVGASKQGVRKRREMLRAVTDLWT